MGQSFVNILIFKQYMARLQRSEVAPQTDSPKTSNTFKVLKVNGI